ncbi:hypothetical protein [Microcoleus sp.]|uniref:hypothetical protein n=1 Tax=Microcoleus sp. TaxID=44472 RepID=UPI00403E8FE6
MLPIDGSYLYKLGGAIRPLTNVNSATPWGEAWLPLYIAAGELEKFINDSVYSRSVRTSRTSANELLASLKSLIESVDKPENKDNALGPLDAYHLSNSLTSFEAVMSAEFGMMPIFLITPKKGYDLNSLVYAGQTLFPFDLEEKVPEAVSDINSGTQCVAFEMWTAAAFHFHRATESVLRKYWESVLPGRSHPGNKTIGDYLRALGKARKGSPKLKSTLRDLKDLYRNPVLHPEYSLSNIEEVSALMGSINAAMVQMLIKIPKPEKLDE